VETEEDRVRAAAASTRRAERLKRRENN